MATMEELYQQSLLGQLPMTGELPTTLTPYQRIMGQMTPTMNPYTGAGVAIGGYDPALYRRMSGSGLINLGGGGGDSGGGGGGGDSGGLANPFGDLTQAERAGYYAENPNMASVTRGLQGLFGLTSLGSLARAMNPGLFSEEALITMGVDPATYQNARESFRASEIADMNAAAEAAQTEAGRQAAQESFRSSEITQQNQDTTPSGGGEGIGGGDISGQSEGTPALAMGGPVDRVGGPNPPGPDDGAGMLQLGEYVIKKSAVNKYGQGLLDMINDGKIPAKKMKSLLG